MAVLILILRVLALVLVGVAAFGVGTPRVHLGWAGIAVWMLADLLQGVHV
jgi:hypothetical protein